MNSLRQYYARAPYASAYLPALEEIIARDWERLVDLNVAVISLMATWLRVSTPVVLSSALPADGERSARLVNICRHFNADRYLSGDSAQDYLDRSMFAAAGIDVEWQAYRHPLYPQLHGAFLSHLSAIDLILNCGPESADILAGRPATRAMRPAQTSIECPRTDVARTWLITGGAGFIGSNFVHYIYERYPNDWIIVLDLLTYAGSVDNLPVAFHGNDGRIDFHYGNVCNSSLVDSFVKEVDDVVHFAAETHVTRSIYDNHHFFVTDVLGTQVVANAVLRYASRVERFIHISTSEVVRHGTNAADERGLPACFR